MYLYHVFDNPRATDVLFGRDVMAVIDREREYGREALRDFPFQSGEP
jgi:hypothetical protein